MASILFYCNECILFIMCVCRFVWKKKIERDVSQGVSLESYKKKNEKKRQIERMVWMLNLILLLCVLFMFLLSSAFLVFAHCQAGFGLCEEGFSSIDQLLLFKLKGLMCKLQKMLVHWFSSMVGGIIVRDINLM